MKIASIVPMLSMIPAVLRGVRPRDIETIKTITRVAFPEVRHISTADFQEWMTASARLTVIDVRSESEFAISHLKGALNARTVPHIQATLRDPGAKLVLYCSVGFRSASLAAAMQKRGFRNVVNLEGSIFQWANEGRPLYSGELLARQVHPFGAMWSGLLKSGLAAKI